jgi:hypothetical protein
MVVGMRFAAQKRTHQDSSVQDDIDLLGKVGTLPKSSSICTASSTHSAEASTFLIRGKHYLRDRKKVCFSPSSKHTYILSSYPTLRGHQSLCYQITYLELIVGIFSTNPGFLDCTKPGGGQRPCYAICGS